MQKDFLLLEVTSYLEVFIWVLNDFLLPIYVFLNENQVDDIIIIIINTGDQSSGGAGERGESGVRAWPEAGGDRGEGQHQHGDPRQHADRQGDGVHHHRVQVRHQCPVEINDIYLTQRSFETGLRGATIYPSVSRYLRILSKYWMVFIFYQDLHPAMKMLGLNPSEQEVVDIPNNIAKYESGLSFFVDQM